MTAEMTNVLKTKTEWKTKTWWTHDAAKLKAVVDFHQLIALVLVQHDKLVERCTDLPSTVEAVNDVFPVLFQNEQNVEYFHLKPAHLNNGPLAATVTLSSPIYLQDCHWEKTSTEGRTYNI